MFNIIMDKQPKFEARIPILEEVRTWVEEYLVEPHPDLGRKGPVCPWAKISYEKGLLTIDSSNTKPDHDELESYLLRKSSEFSAASKNYPVEDREYLVSLIAMSEFSTEADAQLMDGVQASLKVEFMNNGLMIGQFHPFSTIGGLHNPNFRPFYCPVHCFAIRNMIAFDDTFIDQNLAKEDIPKAVAAYLKKFQAVVPIEVLQSRGLID